MNNLIQKAFWHSALSLASGWPGDRRLAILVYHRVLEHCDPFRPGDPVAEEFDIQMRCLSEYFNPVSLLEGVRLLKEGRLPPRAIAITFDDGYEDNVSVAMPILQRYGLCATFFISTAYLDGGIMWNDIVIDCMRDSPHQVVDFSDVGLGLLRLHDIASRKKAVDHLIPNLKHRPPSERQDVADMVAKRSGTMPKARMMTSTQVRSLRDAGMDLGGHTQTHPILASLDRETAEMEIRQGKAELERIVGKPIELFAYPNGKVGNDYGVRDVDLVRHVGFEAAVTTQWGVVGSQSDTFQLPRFTPWDRSLWRFMLRMGWIYRRPV